MFIAEIKNSFSTQVSSTFSALFLPQGVRLDPPPTPAQPGPARRDASPVRPARSASEPQSLEVGTSIRAPLQLGSPFSVPGRGQPQAIVSSSVLSGGLGRLPRLKNHHENQHQRLFPTTAV